jgi:hypothetical protein
MTKLVGVEGIGAGLEIQVGNLGVEIGRQSLDTPQLRDDRWLSGQHARLAWSEGGDLMIVDLNSTNGTYVNAKRITSVRLSAGDLIEVGSSVFRLDAKTVPSRHSAAQAEVAIAGSLDVRDGGVAVARDARDIYSSSARVDGNGVAIGRDYIEGDTIEFDPSGFRSARGLARFFLIVGTLVALVGFGLFGYMMIEAFGSFQEVQAASAECDQNFDLGPAWAECHQNVGMPEIAFFPFGAAGAATMFAGMVVYTFGMMMNRNTDKREEKARRRSRLARRS